jgi:hypothetical protein
MAHTKEELRNQVLDTLVAEAAAVETAREQEAERWTALERDSLAAYRASEQRQREAEAANEELLTRYRELGEEMNEVGAQINRNSYVARNEHNSRLTMLTDGLDAAGFPRSMLAKLQDAIRRAI